jgi:starvation-inducible DNA-binding protein
MPESFAEGLPQKTRTAMIDLLNGRLADTIALTLAAKQAHWNMKGKGFIGVHELMDEVADRLRDGADLMAERVVILGGLAQGTVEVVAKGGNIEPYPTDLVDLQAHVAALVERYKTLGSKLRDAIKQAEDGGDADTADILTGFSRSVDKDAWFIGANAAQEGA